MYHLFDKSWPETLPNAEGVLLRSQSGDALPAFTLHFFENEFKGFPQFGMFVPPGEKEAPISVNALFSRASGTLRRAKTNRHTWDWGKSHWTKDFIWDEPLTTIIILKYVSYEKTLKSIN